MGNFAVLENKTIRTQSVRVSQRAVLPTAIKRRQLSSTFIDETTAEVLGPFSVNDAAQLKITSTISAKVGTNVKIGAVPYMILFGVGTTLASLSFIPFDTAVADFTLNSGMAMPAITGATSVTGTTDTELSIMSLLVNTSGITKNIMVIVHGRYISGSGAGVQD